MESLIGSTWEAFMCVSMCIALLALFKNRFSSQGRIEKVMADNSFTVYLIHIPIIVFLQYLLIGVPIDPLIKFAIVGGHRCSACVRHQPLRDKATAICKIYIGIGLTRIVS